MPVDPSEKVSQSFDLRSTQRGKGIKSRRMKATAPDFRYFGSTSLGQRNPVLAQIIRIMLARHPSVTLKVADDDRGSRAVAKKHRRNLRRVEIRNLLKLPQHVVLLERYAKGQYLALSVAFPGQVDLADHAEHGANIVDRSTQSDITPATWFSVMLPSNAALRAALPWGAKKTVPAESQRQRSIQREYKCLEALTSNLCGRIAARGGAALALAAIVADDFSSATDCGVQFSRRGLATVAMMDLPSPARGLAYQVASIDTDTRAASAEIASARVKQAATLIKASGYRHVYKSIDSTLRGNLGVEIDAMLDVLQPDFAFVAPAFPYWGRTTRDGQHYFNGVPLAESQFAHDPVWPIRDSNLLRLLGAQSRRAVGLVDLACVRGDFSLVSARLGHLKSAGVSVVVFDAETEADLARIAAISASSSYTNLLVGSTGLSQYLVDAWGMAGDAGSDRLVRRPGPVILISGSASPTTHRQISQFTAQSRTFSLPIDARSIITGGFGAAASQHIDLAQAAIDAGDDLAIYLTSSPASVAATQQLGASRGLDRMAVSNLIVESLAGFAARIVASNEPSGLLLTGGDTAKATCAALGADSMRLFTEVEPGVPIGELIGPNRVRVVTKAGAFGTDGVLNRARCILRGDN